MAEPSITCPTCGRTSYHPDDIAQRYCGACSQFHDMMPLILGADAYQRGLPLKANPFNLETETLGHALWFNAWRKAERAASAR